MIVVFIGVIRIIGELVCFIQFGMINVCFIIWMWLVIFRLIKYVIWIFGRHGLGMTRRIRLPRFSKILSSCQLLNYLLSILHLEMESQLLLIAFLFIGSWIHSYYYEISSTFFTVFSRKIILCLSFSFNSNDYNLDKY